MIGLILDDILSPPRRLPTLQQGAFLCALLIVDFQIEVGISGFRADYSRALAPRRCLDDTAVTAYASRSVSVFARQLQPHLGV